MKQLRAIWIYRYFIFSSIKTEFYARFVRSRLGGVWMIVHPLAQVAIYALILSRILSAKLPGIESQYAYSIYLMAGTLAWTFFGEVFGRSIGVFVDNGNLLKKISFPKIALPFIVFGSALVNNLLLLIAILGVFGFLGHGLTLSLQWLPFLMGITLALGAGLGLTLGILNVFIRDIGQIVPIIMQFWFWLTPIVYMPHIIPVQYQNLFALNPMTSIVIGYQDILLYGRTPNLSTLIYPSAIAIITFLLALFIYFRSNEEMVDVL